VEAFKNSTTDGQIWILITDFVRAFSDFQVGYFDDSWYYNYYDQTSDDGALHFYNFTLSSTTAAYIWP
jgi:hypothetical protein